MVEGKSGTAAAHPCLLASHRLSRSSHATRIHWEDSPAAATGVAGPSLVRGTRHCTTGAGKPRLHHTQRASPPAAPLAAAALLICQQPRPSAPELATETGPPLLLLLRIQRTFSVCLTVCLSLSLPGVRAGWACTLSLSIPLSLTDTHTHIHTYTHTQTRAGRQTDRPTH